MKKLDAGSLAAGRNIEKQSTIGIDDLCGMPAYGRRYGSVLFLDASDERSISLSVSP